MAGRTAFWIRNFLGVLVAVLLGLFFTFYFMFGRGIYEPPQRAQAHLFITGGTLFNGTGTGPQPNPGILLQEGRITCVGISCAAPDGARVVDASGLAILPGLIDLHIHFAAYTADNAGMSMSSLIWNMLQMRPDVRRSLLEHGITAIRSVGDPRDFILELKRYLARAEIAGPRLYAAGPIFTAPGGHPAYEGRDPNPSGFGGNMAFQSNDPGQIRQEVASLAESGADGIKAVFHGAADADGRVLLPTLSEESLRALIEEAHAHGLWVAVHVGPLDEVRAAVQAGADTIEHGVRQGNLIDSETLRLLAGSGVVYVPTLGREPMGYLNIPALYEAGVMLGVGTDTNNPEMHFGDSYHSELQAMVAAGLPEAEVLLAATRNGAIALGMASELGTVEVGKLADLILVRGEPWNDISTLQNPAMVIQKGMVMVEAVEAGKPAD